MPLMPLPGTDEPYLVICENPASLGRFKAAARAPDSRQLLPCWTWHDADTQNMQWQ